MTPSACAASSSGSLEWVVVVLGLAAGFVLFLESLRRFTFRRLEAWTRRENLQLLDRELRWWRRGPFDALGQYSVFRIRVRDVSGAEKRGWVRFGGHWNWWSEETEARWDDPS